MAIIKWVWVIGLAALYGMFWLWYGGSAVPLSVAEGAALLDRIDALNLSGENAEHTSDFRAHMEELIAADDGRELFMVNLETALPGPEAQAADEAYAAIVVPLLLARGSFPLFVGEPTGLMLGEYGADIDRVAIIRYRSLRDLLDMNLDPAMQEGIPYKFASLEHTEVFPTRAIISTEQLRLTLALILLVLGFGGWKLLERFSR